MARRHRLKRPSDSALALVLLLLSLPLWLLIIMAIYLEDRGAPFFLQERCGLRGKTFRTIKFRTMKQPEKDAGPHKVVYVENDPRVAKVGRFLRATALDELPELINILKGDMSFVGPRPVPYRIEAAQPYRTIEEIPGYELRSQVRPGLTGIAQVYAPKDADGRSKFRYDNLYVKKQSLWLDAKLILLSIVITLRGKWD